jgi:hypothetical protein
MKTKTRLFVPLACLTVLSFLMFSCKKESATTAAVAATNNLNPEDVAAKSNLVAWYKFTNGNTGDFSGSNNHLSPHNVTLATDYMGRPNNAYAFNGTSSYMQAPNSSSLNPSSAISLVALFKPTGFYTGEGETSRILMKGADDQSNGDYFLGYYNTGQIYGTYGDNQFNSNGVGSPEGYLQLNTWYKLIYTYDGSVGRLYVDGTLVGGESKVATFTANNSPLRIGKTGRSDFPYFFNGVIDEIRIYNTALTNNQVKKVDAQLGQ